MVKEIVFNNLPFVPISGQVIYVESSYHERLNTFIHDHYIWLRELFENCGFEFCYLPSLSEEAIRYRVPTLTPEKCREIIEHLPSLAQYAVGAEVIEPSLVFALDFPIEDAHGNTILQSVAIKEKWYLSLKWTFKLLANKIKRAARDLKQDYYKHRPRRQKTSEDIKQDDTVGAKKEEENRKSSAVRFCIENDEKQKSASSTGDTHFSIEEEPGSIFESIRFSIDDNYVPKTNNKSESSDYADDQFGFQAEEIIEEIKVRIRALQVRGVNTLFLHDLIDECEHVSRLRITKDFRIFLIDYNMEVRLSVLPKAVFLLFLHHPEGIRFKELADYYSELLQIYLKLNPIGGRMRQEQSIRDITNPCSNSINEKCARIREAFVSNFDERLAKNYFITGRRGEPKRIVLDPSMVIWE